MPCDHLIIICKLLFQLLQKVSMIVHRKELLSWGRKMKQDLEKPRFISLVHWRNSPLCLWGGGAGGKNTSAELEKWSRNPEDLSFIVPAQCRSSLAHREGRGNPAPGWKKEAEIVKIQASFLQPSGGIYFYAWRGEELLQWAGEMKWGCIPP